MALMRMKDFTCYAKNVSTGAEDTGMQKIYLTLKLPSELSGML